MMLKSNQGVPKAYHGVSSSSFTSGNGGFYCGSHYIIKQGHIFIAVKNAKFRGTAISQKAKFRGHFAVKMPNFAAISRRKFKISRLFRGQYCSEMTQLVTI